MRRPGRNWQPDFVGREDGASMVEFALISGLLFMFLFGIIDFGRALYQYNNLTNAAREGARFGATRFPNPCLETDAIIALTAQRIMEFNDNAAVNPSRYVSVKCEPPAVSTPNKVVVKITSYPFQAVTPLPFLNGLTFGTAAIPIDAVVRFEGAAGA